jgi:DNA mismatch repair protein MutS
MPGFRFVASGVSRRLRPLTDPFMTAITPMMQQYRDAKEACGDAILLFRMGDFYELFFDDAKDAAKILGLTLTSRDKGENPIPMAGFPYHQLDSYLRKLILAGRKAAVCEQVEDPKKAKGIVRREITRLVSAGAVTDDELLSPGESNYLFALWRPKIDSPKVGCAWAELSTGDFWAATVEAEELVDLLAAVRPAELLCRDDVPHGLPAHAVAFAVTTRPAWEFGPDTAGKHVRSRFGVRDLEGLGFGEEDVLAISAAGAALGYLLETQKTSLAHFDRLQRYETSAYVEIDAAARRSLELDASLRRGNREGTLLAALDRTETSMGARRLAQWMERPLRDAHEIARRQDAVEALVAARTVRRDLRDLLKQIYDLERLTARVATRRASPRDLRSIVEVLNRLPEIVKILEPLPPEIASSWLVELDLCEDVRSLLCESLADECPTVTRDGGFIRAGFREELDRLRELARGGKQWIAQYQAREAQRLGIPGLKIGFNKVFGYFIELTAAQALKAPADFIRKQTLKNAERFVTPELKEYEEQVLSADEKAIELEEALFIELRDAVEKQAARLRTTGGCLAQLDVLASFAEIASERRYVRPTIVEEPILRVEEGRHPVLDQLEREGTLVPNDCLLDEEHGTLALITGPNMAGKSTYIRQQALIVFLAQIGCFVPARSATVGIADRIFARVGASDDIFRGRSTFMVEMTETARILNLATRNSLVILDEIGRGTSTYDGVSLAWAITERLHDAIGCRCLFATHYHELTALAERLPRLRNLNVAVREWKDEVVFLHKIVPGGADRSYGIHVAKLAGVPNEVIGRAEDLLAAFESDPQRESDRKTVRRAPAKRRTEVQLTLFEAAPNPIVEELRELRLDAMTPLEALAWLNDRQKKIREEMR